MRYFPLFDFQMVVLLTFLGIVVLLLLSLAFGARSGRTRREGDEKVEEYPEGIQVARRRVPGILIFIYIAFIVWALAYLVVVGLRGGPI